MIAIDASVLVRYVVEDDAVQSQLAADLIEGASATVPLFIPLIALAEMCWVLRRRYKAAETQIAAAVQSLLDARHITVEQSDVVRLAFQLDHEGIADRLIHSAAVHGGCSHTVTFDRRFARLDGVELLA